MNNLPTCEHYDEMWQAILARCEELKAAAPRRHGDSRSQAMIHGDGNGVSAIFSIGQEDGTDAVYHIQAHHWRRHGDIGVSVDAWLNNRDAFWEKELADRDGAVVIGHEHYRIHPDLRAGERGIAGYGGRLFRIRMLATGDVIETRNLWHQGTITPPWRDRLPATAVFFYPESECSFCGEHIKLLGDMWTAGDGTVGCTDTSAPFVGHKPKEDHA